MPHAYNVILALSLVANGGLAGLIAGHLLTQSPSCMCDSGGRRKIIRDDGPFPTGWVVPDPGPAKPPKPKPSGAMQ